MITASLLASSKRRLGGSAPPVFGGMDSLFGTGQRGAYYDFTDLSSLAANADGTGGAPLPGESARWCRDLSPNANHLRNTVSSVTVSDNGVTTSGQNYGLFNMPGFGNWPVIAEPLVMIARIEIQSFGHTDDRITGSNGSGQILQGTAAGKVRLFSNYSPEVEPGLHQEVTLVGVWNGSLSSIELEGSPAIPWSSVGGAMDALCLGSGTGPGPCASVRFRRLFVRAGLLSALDLTGVKQWVKGLMRSRFSSPSASQECR